MADLMQTFAKAYELQTVYDTSRV